MAMRGIIGEQMDGVTGAGIGSLMLRYSPALALPLAHGIGKVPPSGRFIDLVSSMGFPLRGPHVFAEFGGGLLPRAGC